MSGENRLGGIGELYQRLKADVDHGTAALTLVPNFNARPRDTLQAWRSKTHDEIATMDTGRIRCFLSFDTEESAAPYHTLFATNSHYTDPQGKHHYRLNGNLLTGGSKDKRTLIPLASLAFSAFDVDNQGMTLLSDAEKKDVQVHIVRVGKEYALVMAGHYGMQKDIGDMLAYPGLWKPPVKGKPVTGQEMHARFIHASENDSCIAVVSPLPQALAESIARAHNPKILEKNTFAALLSSCHMQPEIFLPNAPVITDNADHPPQMEEAPGAAFTPPTNPEDIAQALALYQAVLKGKRGNTGAVEKYWLEMSARLDMRPSVASDPSLPAEEQVRIDQENAAVDAQNSEIKRIKQLFPSPKDLLAALQKEGLRAILPGKSTTTKFSVNVAASEELFASSNSLLQELVASVQIAPFHITKRKTNEIRLVYQVNGIRTFPRVKIFLMQEGERHYLLATADRKQLPPEAMTLLYNKLSIPAPKPLTISALDERNYYSKVEIAPAVYRDLAHTGTLPEIEAASFEDDLRQATANPVSPAQPTDNSAHAMVTKALQTPLSPEQLAQKQAKVAGALTDIIAKRLTTSEEAYLTRVHEGADSKAYAYLIVSKAHSVDLRRQIQIANEAFDLKNGESMTVQNLSSGDAYSLVRIALPETAYENLEENGLATSPFLAAHLVGFDHQEITRQTIVHAQQAHDWLSQKTRELNEEAREEKKARRRQRSSERLTLRPPLIKAMHHTEGRICTVTLPDVKTFDRLIEEAQRQLTGAEKWAADVGKPFITGTAQTSYVATIGTLLATPSEIRHVPGQQAMVQAHASRMIANYQNEVRELIRLRALVALHNTTEFPAIVLRGPAKRYGAEQWRRMRDAVANPGTTFEGLQDRESGLPPDRTRDIIRIHEVDLGEGKDRHAAVMLLTPALYEAVAEGVATKSKEPVPLAPEAIPDGQLNRVIADHYAPDYISPDRKNRESIPKLFSKLGFHALVTHERKSAPETREVRVGNKTFHQSAPAARGEKGAQPVIYIAVNDARTRGNAVDLLAALHHATLLRGQIHDDTALDDAPTNAQGLRELRAQFDEIHALRDVKSITDYSWLLGQRDFNSVWVRENCSKQIDLLLHQPEQFLEIPPWDNPAFHRLVHEFEQAIETARMQVEEETGVTIKQCTDAMLTGRPLTDAEMTALTQLFSLLSAAPTLWDLVIEQESIVNKQYEQRYPEDAKKYWHIKNRPADADDVTPEKPRRPMGPAVGIHYPNAASPDILEDEGTAFAPWLKRQLPEATPESPYIIRCELLPEQFQASTLEAPLRGMREGRFADHAIAGFTEEGKIIPRPLLEASRKLDGLRHHDGETDAVIRQLQIFHDMHGQTADLSAGRA